MVFNRIQRIWRPAVFHGRRDRQFEGWYYKLVDKTAQNVFAIIPGVIYNPYRGPNPYQSSHAFIQIFNGSTGEYNYIPYELEQFNAVSKEFLVKIGKNEFKTDQISLNIDRDNLEVSGVLRFLGLSPWPIGRLAPGAMGPLAFLPRLECFHAILSFNHQIQGGFAINGSMYDFEGGKGYIGKEWGSSHPSSWIWIQSNHFKAEGTALNVSIAHIPYLLWKFPGFAVGFLHENKLYRFTTYNRSKISDLEVGDHQVFMRISNRKHLLEVTAEQGSGAILRSPDKNGMLGEVFESLVSTVIVKLFERRESKLGLVFEGKGYPAGMEVKGDMTELRFG